MKNLYCFVLLTALALMSCSTGSRGVFSKKTQHEKYAEKLDKTDLDKTPAGRAWLAAAQSSLINPQEISLPYAQNGLFHADKPRALGLSFSAKRGERISFRLRTATADQFVIYADLFKPGVPGQEELVLSGDTNAAEFSFEVESTGDYILRLQPEIARNGRYQLTINRGPSLLFPVAGPKASIGSFWGADRDGGKRRHEGIDIFAPKKTPVVAGADGYVTGVKDGGIGGKTVWLRVDNRNITLYYAHLDQQLVREGQYVKKGETIGLVGNTGNARTTPPHLHFGIYTFQGAEDPLVFVKKNEKSPESAPDKDLSYYLKLLKPLRAGTAQLKAQTLMVPLAVTTRGYIAETPEGQRVHAAFSQVSSSKQPVEG